MTSTPPTPPATRGVGLGHVLGARVVVQPSALVMVALLAWVFASSAGPVTGRTFVVGLILAVALFVSIFVHELAHAIAARAYRRRVREIVVTLWGGHTSYDSADLSPGPLGVTAAAGPVMNLLIALVAHLVSRADVVHGLTGAVVAWLGWANVFLAIFNLLPGIPMDGGRVVEALVWRLSGNRFRGTVVAAWGGRVVAIGVVVYAIAAPIARGENVDLISLVWAGLIGSILWPAASAALTYSRVMSRREGVTAGTLMRPAVAVAYSLSVAQARDAAMALGAADVVVLSADGMAGGRCEMATTDAVPAEARATTSLAAVMIPVPRGAEVDASLTGEDLVRELRQWWGRTDVWVVRERGQVSGVVALQSVLDALQ